MPRAVLIGGNGQIGRAVAPALARDGWDVVAVSRSGDLPAGFAELDTATTSQPSRASAGAAARPI